MLIYTVRVLHSFSSSCSFDHKVYHCLVSLVSTSFHKVYSSSRILCRTFDLFFAHMCLWKRSGHHACSLLYVLFSNSQWSSFTLLAILNVLKQFMMFSSRALFHFLQMFLEDLILSVCHANMRIKLYSEYMTFIFCHYPIKWISPYNESQQFSKDLCSTRESPYCRRLMHKF